DLVTSLVDKSLLRPMETSGDDPRYAMLETIREFAGEQLTASGEAETVRERHADWCLKLARDVQTAIEPPIVRAGALDRLNVEHGNLRAAMTWLDHPRGSDKLTQLATDLRWFWYLTGHAAEGLGWLGRVLNRGLAGSEPEHREALLQAGHLALELQDPAAIAYLREGRSLAQVAGDIVHQARAALLLGMFAEDTGKFAEAETLLTSARSLYLQTDLWWYQLVTGHHLGIVALGQGDSTRANVLLEAVVAEARDRGEVFLQC
ncbi:MAG: hypothetical protein ACR2GI_02705, partial [Thermomicrobiales bacterium]